MVAYRVSHKLLRDLPPLVAATVKYVAEDYGLSTLRYERVGADHQFYAAEGSRFWAVRGDELAHVEMAAEHNLGAVGLCPQVGRRFSLPVGSWLVEVAYYGKYFMYLYHVASPDQGPNQKLLSLAKGGAR